MFRNACILTRAHRSAEEREPIARPLENEVLFVHGRYGDGSSWDSFAPFLAGQANSRSLELPGFGRSFCMDERSMSLHELVELTVEVLRSEIRSREGARWVLMAHDLGALIAQMAAIELSRQKSPVVVDLVLLSPASLSSSRIAPGKLGRLLSRAKLRYLLQTSPGLEKFERAQLSPPASAVLRSISETWPGPIERLTWTRGMREFSGSVLVLWGARDRLNPSDQAQELVQNYPDVEYFEHESGGHWLSLEEPDWVSEKVNSFLFRRQRRRKAV